MTRLYFRESGNTTNETILFLHGGGISSRMWMHELETLTKYHCLAPDLPGHGGSADVAPFTLADSVAGLGRLIEEYCDGKPVSLVAFSVGVVVALALVAEHPEKVKRLFLSGPTPDFGRMSTLTFNLLARPLLALMPAAQRTVLLTRSLNLTSEQAALFAEDLRQINLDLVRRINAAVTNQPQIGMSEIPALITVGGREIGAVKKRAVEILQSMPNGLGYTVPNVGHAWSLEAPELFHRTIGAWLANEPLPTEFMSFE